MPLASPLPDQQERPVGRDLVRVGVAVGGRHAADFRDPHAENVQAGGLLGGLGLFGGGFGRGLRRRRLTRAAPLGADAPPGLAAPAGAVEPDQAAQHRGSDCRDEKHESLGSAVRQDKSLRAGKPDCLEPAAIDLSRCLCTNRATGRKLRQIPSNTDDGPLRWVLSPSESLARRAPARAGWRAARAVARAG